MDATTAAAHQSALIAVETRRESDTTGSNTPPVPYIVRPGSDVTRHAKRKLLSCRIEGHTIQKSAPVKKKALDPLRYMSDRAAFYALFSVVTKFDDVVGDRLVHRTYKQFNSLHSKLQKKYPKSNLPRDLPTMRKKRYDNEYIEQKRSDLNRYLLQLMAIPEVKESRIFREFVEDSQLSDSSEEEEFQTSAKLLEGLPGTIVTVRAGQSFSVSLNLPNSGDVISWQFTTKKHNIGFSATFNGELIRAYAREDSQLKPVKGFYRCQMPGTCTLNWDNTYTWRQGKVLIYWAEVEKSRTMSSPTLRQQSMISGDLNSMDARRSGYIAQSRNHALYPRRIMNSSISLIKKPFISGGKHQQLPQKAGSLIIERNVKFRGRNWYRKWFVLDTRKGVLSCYDSETTARRGLSITKLNLNNKAAALAIVSSDEAAPTPYMFIVRTRQRNWKICASSVEEFNEWEHAISTAILTAQLSRRRRTGSYENEDENLVTPLEGGVPGQKTISNPSLQEDNQELEEETSDDSEDENDGVKDEEDESDEYVPVSDRDIVPSRAFTDMHPLTEITVEHLGSLPWMWKLVLLVLLNGFFGCMYVLPDVALAIILLLANGFLGKHFMMKLKRARKTKED